ncbi:hypothetical protein BH10PSE18_BH10PSE18_43500 [soil metagenome]
MLFDFKNARASDSKREYARIAKDIGDDGLLSRREFRQLPKVLVDREPLLCFTAGAMGGHHWLIALTDRRLLFLRKGWLRTLQQTSIDLGKVNAVSSHLGIFSGKLVIEEAGAQRVVERVRKKTVLAFSSRARDAIEARRIAVRRPTSPGGSTSLEDVVGRLERLAALVDKGILTPEEFVQQKRKMLVS